MATRTTKRELEAEVELQQMRIRELEMLLAAKNNPGLSFKVSTRGAISIYGLQKFPITLYRNQWEKGETQAPINHQLRTAQNRMLSVRKLGRSVDGKLDRRYRRPRPWLMVSLDRMSGHIASRSRIEEHVVDRLTVLEIMSLLDPQQRRCLALLYQGFTLAEVAGQLQKPRAEVDKIVSDIREQLLSWQRRNLEERVS